MDFLKNAFSKMKQLLGIGGVKITINIPEDVKKDSNTVSGVAIFTTKSDQKVNGIKIKCLEQYSVGRGENRSTTEYELGNLFINESFTIKEGDEKKVSFTLPFELIESENENLKQTGGISGALGSADSFLNNENSVYEVQVSATVEGTTFGPLESKEINLV